MADSQPPHRPNDDGERESPRAEVQQLPAELLQLIDKLDDLVKGAKHVPFGDQLRVNTREIRGLLDQMRTAMPEEIKEARWIVQERRELLSEGESEAERIDGQARDRRAELVSGHELIRDAERAAAEIIERARMRERELHSGAENYAEETLSTLELNLAKRVAAIQRGRERLRTDPPP